MLPLFFDRDVGRSVPDALRALGVEVQSHRERYPSGDRISVADDDWIPEVTADGYVIITHDSRIRRRRGEWDVFQAAGARCFVLAMNRPHRFVFMRALMLAWDDIEGIVAVQRPPFMYGLQASGKLTPYVGPKA